MGLCKCPKKKVTNLFCFEHRVNVCEHCLVESHRGCVVQSYLQWLTDSDFDTNCSLCEHPLAEYDTVRLQCLHIVHWACLDAWAQKFPATTAPAGYRCPFCNEGIFPAVNQTSPMIDELKSHLEKSNWGRVGLGLPAIAMPSNASSVPPPPALSYSVKNNNNSNKVDFSADPKTNSSFPVYEAATPHNSNYRSATPATALDLDDVSYSTSNEHVTFTSRKKQYGGQEDAQPLIPNERDADSEDNKYKRRPAREWLRGIWRAKYGDSPHSDKFSGYKKTLFIIFLCIVLLVTIITVLTSVGVGSGSDPLLDPMSNPNIRVAAEDSLSNHI